MSKLFQTGPALRGLDVVPDDGAILPFESRALWVGGGGNLTVTMSEGGSVTFQGVPAGTLLPVSVSQVLATGTSATAIVALV